MAELGQNEASMQVSDKAINAGAMDKEVGKVEDKSSRVKVKRTTKGKK